ncbi:MAG: hypothetical protein V1754_14230 [Pseudomonadota bacterium]
MLKDTIIKTVKLVFLAIWLSCCFACQLFSEQRVSREQKSTVVTNTDKTELFLFAGSGPGQVGFQPRKLEQLAEGVSAVAVDPDGSVYVLDRLNRRVLRVAQGGVSSAAQVPEDTEYLATGADGTIASYSPLRSRVWLAADGEDVGQIDIPRVFREVQRIGIGPSLQVRIFTAFQESFWIGSPNVPRTLGSMLHSKREGAVFLEDGTGVAVRRLSTGRPEILQYNTEGQIVDRRLLENEVLAARVIGASCDAVCLRLEEQMDGPAFHVHRKVDCFSPKTGEVFFSRELPTVGEFVPKIELAMGGCPARLAFIRPTSEGLHVWIWNLPQVTGRGVQ